MKRRTFCKTTLGAGIAAALPTTSTLAALNALAPLEGDISAVTTSGDEISIEQAAAIELKESLSGALLFPNDDGYESARQVWTGQDQKQIRPRQPFSFECQYKTDGECLNSMVRNVCPY
jgi:hypothetical protein